MVGQVRRVRIRRSDAEKRQIVEQTLEPGTSVARAHGVNANVVFHWRREYRERKLAETGLIPVVMIGDVSSKHVPGYVEADLTMKQRALNRLQPAKTNSLRYRSPDQLMKCLELVA